MKINDTYYHIENNVFYTITEFKGDYVHFYWANMTTQKNGFNYYYIPAFEMWINMGIVTLVP